MLPNTVPCARCGTDLPIESKFCNSCGTPVVSPGTSLGESAPPIGESISPESSAAPPATGDAEGDFDRNRPYRWGSFQGGALVFLMPAGILARIFSGEKTGALFLGLFWALYGLPLGLGILKKRRYALKMVYGCIALSFFPLLLITSIDPTTLGKVFGQVFVSLLIWIPSTVYYYKRRDEFT
jgi:hypothetical protein